MQGRPAIAVALQHSSGVAQQRQQQLDQGQEAQAGSGTQQSWARRVV